MTVRQNVGKWRNREQGESEASRCPDAVQAALLLGRCLAARCSTVLCCPVSLFLRSQGDRGHVLSALLPVTSTSGNREEVSHLKKHRAHTRPLVPCQKEQSEFRLSTSCVGGCLAIFDEIGNKQEDKMYVVYCCTCEQGLPTTSWCFPEVTEAV